MPSSRSNLKPRPESEPPEPVRDWSFDAIGTKWWIGLYEPLSMAKLGKIKQAITRRIRDYDATYSRFRPDSLVSRIARRAGTYDFPADGRELFDWYRQLYDGTAGRVTPLIGQTLSDAGYDATYSLRPGQPHTPPAWDAVMSYDGITLTTNQPVLLDFGAAGKGHLVDIVSAMLLASGVRQFCVDAGGDLRCHGLTRPLRIGLEHPSNAEQVIGVAEVGDGALCGSAGNRRAWASYHHIIDPQSLMSPRHISALWVSAADALTADGLATALYFVPPAELKERFRFEHCIMYADSSADKSARFQATLFTKGSD